MFFKFCLFIAFIKCDKFHLETKNGHKQIVSDQAKPDTLEAGNDYMDSTGSDQIESLKDLLARAKQKLKEEQTQNKAENQTKTTQNKNKNALTETGNDYSDKESGLSKSHKKDSKKTKKMKKLISKIEKDLKKLNQNVTKAVKTPKVLAEKGNDYSNDEKEITRPHTKKKKTITKIDNFKPEHYVSEHIHHNKTDKNKSATIETGQDYSDTVWEDIDPSKLGDKKDKGKNKKTKKDFEKMYESRMQTWKSSIDNKDKTPTGQDYSMTTPKCTQTSKRKRNEEVFGCGGTASIKCTGGCITLLKTLFDCKSNSGKDNDPAHLDIAKKACEGKENCKLEYNEEIFGKVSGCKSSEFKLSLEYYCNGHHGFSWTFECKGGASHSWEEEHRWNSTHSTNRFNSSNNEHGNGNGHGSGSNTGHNENGGEKWGHGGWENHTTGSSSNGGWEMVNGKWVKTSDGYNIHNGTYEHHGNNGTGTGTGINEHHGNNVTGTGTGTSEHHGNNGTGNGTGPYEHHGNNGTGTHEHHGNNDTNIDTGDNNTDEINGGVANKTENNECKCEGTGGNGIRGDGGPGGNGGNGIGGDGCIGGNGIGGDGADGKFGDGGNETGDKECKCEGNGGNGVGGNRGPGGNGGNGIGGNGRNCGNGGNRTSGGKCATTCSEKSCMIQKDIPGCGGSIDLACT